MNLPAVACNNTIIYPAFLCSVLAQSWTLTCYTDPAQKSAHFLCYSQRLPSGLRVSRSFAGSDMKANSRKAECVLVGPPRADQNHQTPNSLSLCSPTCSGSDPALGRDHSCIIGDHQPGRTLLCTVILESPGTFSVIHEFSQHP
jgi:hypothetical protein